MSKIYTKVFPDLDSLFVASGLEIETSPWLAKYAYTDIDSYVDGFVKDCTKFGINISLSPLIQDKRWLMEKVLSLGFSSIPTYELNSRTDLENFPFNKIIAKPSQGYGRTSPSPFDYITYNSKEEALVAFDNDTTDTLETRKPILQPSYAVDGFSKILMVSATINGSGQIHLEPCVLATHKEGGGSVHFATRGCNDNIPGADVAKNTVSALVRSLNIRNAFVQVQFIWTGTEYIAMDASYRMDYHNRYILTKFGDTHPQNIVRFAFDLSETVESVCDTVTVMKYINISPSINADGIKQAMSQKNVMLLEPHRQDRWRLFGTIGTTEEETVNRMKEFETIVSG